MSVPIQDSKLAYFKFLMQYLFFVHPIHPKRCSSWKARNFMTPQTTRVWCMRMHLDLRSVSERLQAWPVLKRVLLKLETNQ